MKGFLTVYEKIWFVSFVLFLLVMAFMAGSWYSGRASGTGGSGGRKILYYVDPMNAGHRYDKPGTAPCGMALEPVYADGGGAAAGMSSMPAGTVQISPEKQQLIGVRVEQVEKTSANHTNRMLERVEPDETRVYRINAFVDGWIRKGRPPRQS
jgi:Cu(I)/Ag(I) efflux system membrane fusion protein